MVRAENGARQEAQVHTHTSTRTQRTYIHREGEAGFARGPVNRAIRCYQLCRFLFVIAAGAREMCAVISDIAPQFSD